jgi:DNA polymerase I-like protein with 3'-5' exonuclease and polymerase domains
MYTFLPFEQKVTGLTVCWSSSAVYFISLTTKNKHKQHEIDERWAVVRRVMANPKPKKVQFNMKPQLKMFLSHGVDGKNSHVIPSVFVLKFQ